MSDLDIQVPAAYGKFISVFPLLSFLSVFFGPGGGVIDVPYRSPSA